MKYHLTLVPEEPFDGWRLRLARREFEASNDAEAIMHAENPPKQLKFVLPGGDGTCGAVPRKLVELTEPERVVKEW
jgi:hypothetical protein